MNKAHLRYIDNQYILTVDERPEIEDIYYYQGHILVHKSLDDFIYYIDTAHVEFVDFRFAYKIIASENLEGLPKIKFQKWSDSFTNREVLYEIIDGVFYVKSPNA